LVFLANVGILGCFIFGFVSTPHVSIPEYLNMPIKRRRNNSFDKLKAIPKKAKKRLKKNSHDIATFSGLNLRY